MKYTVEEKNPEYLTQKIQDMPIGTFFTSLEIPKGENEINLYLKISVDKFYSLAFKTCYTIANYSASEYSVIRPIDPIKFEKVLAYQQ